MGRARIFLTLRPAILFAGMLLVALSPAKASDLTLRQFHHKAWTSRDGAPLDVWALAEGPHGYLWLGTGSGIYLFDGVTFEPFRPAPGERLQSIDVTALKFASNGDLWIGYSRGGVSLFRNGHLTHFTEEEDIAPALVFKFVEAPDKTIWMASILGIAQYRDGLWYGEMRSNNPALKKRTWSITLDRNNRLWSDVDQSLKYLEAGSVEFNDTGIEVGEAIIAEAPDGRLWVADTAEGTGPVADLKGSIPTVSHGPRALPELSARNLLFARDGSLWGTNRAGGIFRIAEPAAIPMGGQTDKNSILDTFTLADGLTSDIAVPLLEDREGNIWVGTNLGLNRFRRNDVILLDEIPVTSPDGYTLAFHEEKMFVTDTTAVYIFEPGRPVRTLSRPPSIYSSLLTSHGEYWLATSTGVFHLQGDVFTHVPYPTDLRLSSAFFSVEDEQGNLIVTTNRDAIFGLGAEGWQSVPGAEQLALGSKTAFAHAPHGGLWVGYANGLVALLKDGQLQTYTEADGLSIGIVTVFFWHEDTLWVGGEFGIAVLKGERFKTIPYDRVPSLLGISGITDAEDGSLWINGMAGIVRLKPDALQQLIHGTEELAENEVFDSDDGLDGIAQQFSQMNTAVRGPEGRLWFITNHGIVWIDPSARQVNTLPPPVLVKTVRTTDHSFPADGGIRLPSGTSRLRVDYTALSLSSPERITFHYRLEGLEEDWTDAGNSREASYNNLKPGRYRFNVIAANEDGIWNQTGDTADIEIPPAFFQTRWFIALCISVLFAVVFALYSIRLQQITERTRQKMETRLRERERIARELHDTLLQGFQGLILRFQAAVSGLPENDHTRQKLEDALETADRVLVEARDQVQDLRKGQAESDIAIALAEEAEQLAREYGTSFQLTTEGSPRILHPVAHDEVLKLVREALLNAFNHSKADRIEVEITFLPRELRLCIRDDGIGMTATRVETAANDGHFGISGMQERAEKIHGRLGLWSRPGMGTEVTLAVPAAIAYPSRGLPAFRRRGRNRDLVET